MTVSDKTLIAALLDHSGSMSSSKEATEDGWAELINEQSGLPGECLVTLAEFDDRYDHLYSSLPVKELPKFVLTPRGMTAMLDAVGKFITEIGEGLAALDEDARPGQVICLIMTDGMENASHEWTWDKVKALITQQQDEWNWKFIFLGANIDAVSVAADMGIQRGSAMTFNAVDYTANVGSYAAASASIVNTRSGMADSFTDDDRSKAAGKPVTSGGKKK